MIFNWREITYEEFKKFFYDMENELNKQKDYVFFCGKQMEKQVNKYLKKYNGKGIIKTDQT